MNIYQLAEHDERIDTECQRLLPTQPHVAAYIASCLRAGDGSVLVARLMCEALQSVKASATVDLATVQALAVEDESNKSQRGQLCAEVRRRDPQFVTRGSHFLFALQGSHEQWRTKDGKVMMRAPLAVKRGGEASRYFGAVFNCAYTMLIGVPKETLHSEAA